jgi:hypothetical protein
MKPLQREYKLKGTVYKKGGRSRRKNIRIMQEKKELTGLSRTELIWNSYKIILQKILEIKKFFW